MYNEDINILALSIIDDIPLEFDLTSEMLDELYTLIRDKIDLEIGEGYKHQMG